ncbi:MAG TPA: hypothetical protein PKO15_02235 [Fibrobacteria bacterium]|nr:hypothetical protein [Fibrobacteria bacterium]
MGFVPGMVRYLGTAALLQLIFFAILRVALFLRVREFEIPTFFAMVSPVLSLGLAPLFFRRFTSTRTALFTALGCTLACLYLLVRFGYAWVAQSYHRTNVEPVLRRFHYVDLTQGNQAPPSMESYLPLDTSRLDSMDMGATTLTSIRQNISEKLHIRCDATVEEAIRASAGFAAFDLGSKRDAELLFCAGTIASLTIPSNDSGVYLDSHRVVLDIVLRSKTRIFEQIRGDIAITFFPDTAVFRIRHNRDSLRRWREDSAKAASANR